MRFVYVAANVMAEIVHFFFCFYPMFDVVILGSKVIVSGALNIFKFVFKVDT